MTSESAVMTRMLVQVSLLLLLHQTDGFGRGAPGSTCWTRYPKHNHQDSQAGPSPYTVQLSSQTYTPSQEIEVKISDPSATRLTFTGLQIAAFVTENGQPSPNFGSEQIVGQFTGLTQSKTKVFSCYPGYKNMVTHANGQPVWEVVLKWRAPAHNLGNLTFRATVVQNYNTFWVDQTVPLNVDTAVTEPVVASHFQKPMLAAPQFTDIDLGPCGDTKGCLLHPRHCAGLDCLGAVSFVYRQATDDFLFEMLSSANDNYISMALSDDDVMGDDETVSCVADGGAMSIQHGRNPGYYNERVLNEYVSGLEIKQSDGVLQCRFTLPRDTSIPVVQQAAGGPTLTYSNISYSHDTPRYIHLAWGPSMRDTTVMTKHHEMPPVSTDKIQLSEIAVHFASQYHILVQVHAALMMIGWILFSGIVTVISRHYKEWLPLTKICGTKVWFQIHRGLGILIAVLTGVGIAVIFTHYGTDEIREPAGTHAYCGIALTAAVALQVLAGMLRPGPDSSLRPWFNWGHWLLGQGSHILATVTMFLAFDIEYISKDMRKFGYIALGVFVGIQLCWHFIFEIVKCRRKSQSFDFDSQKVGSGESKLDSVYLAVYVLCLAGVCVAALLSFLLY